MLSGIKSSFNVQEIFSYDENNNQTSTKIINSDNKYIMNEKHYNNDLLESTIDENGNKTSYNFNSVYKFLDNFINSKGIKTNYQYDDIYNQI